ncbi:hypothetical protein [Vibrio paucivorans]|uniref:hypothetical protein n=1 Tax=Vibrio paucivorans TaxID=2829489 RepID=UPI0036F3454F
MATIMTWLSADQLYEQTQNSVHSRAVSIATTATVGISDWVNIRKDIATAFNDYSQQSDVVPFYNKPVKRVGLTTFS